jgi:ATP citrate (pro-S)-lyase|eukprot:CAMPEP_0169095562 /NCGR_PEP_ID=MMETSP1015-20121227/18540_1 /TAXON_ID=342587 /ORGANISM="Karlodinium micrum, Strain CCMP2283" /LENGTH=1090 /DNA_ID=CAMNT_0009156285 /DNA_START=57 /DNA_END=3329 /DNA_ORIENTATION=+
MSVKPIREYAGKKIMQALYPDNLGLEMCLVSPDVLSKPDPWTTLSDENPWLLTKKLVVKPDQLVKRRGKHGLVYVNKTYEEARKWIEDRMQKEITLDGVAGILDHFIIEPATPHKDEEEVYVCIQSHRYFDEIFFYHQGGVDVGDVDAKALRLQIPVDVDIDKQAVINELMKEIPASKKDKMATFIVNLYNAVFLKAHFTYLEINPVVMTETQIVPLDCAAKIDETAAFLAEQFWQGVDFPAPFGRAAFPEEKFIQELDSKTGASLKLTILNIHGNVWTMVAGGGASVVFADTVCDYGYGHELANYGEYSGAPSTEETYLYAKTLLSLMTRYKRDGPKYLFVGGGIANFTDVNATFAGLIKALGEYRDELLEHRVQIWVRRAGLNHIEGLKNIKTKVTAMNVPIKVYGPEAPATLIVPMALGLTSVLPETFMDEGEGKPTKTPTVEFPEGVKKAPLNRMSSTLGIKESHPHVSHKGGAASLQMTEDTQCLVFNLQTAAVQRMLDFDFMCKRKKPSVAALVYAFGGTSNVKVYWGTQEIFIPVYTTVKAATDAHPNISVMVNFASFRSVFESTMEALEVSDKIKTIAIIAEGVPERQTRSIIKKAESLGVGIIGPATVGGITPGRFRIGNTGGAIENITMSKLYRKGSVCYVSKSGGMSNELNNIIARSSDGVCDGVAIGGDRYPGSRFIDHFLKYESNPDCKLIVMLGEVGGVDEYDVMEAVKKGEITKPVVAWCVGTCASAFSYDVQFGHAGAQARGDMEKARAKNEAMKNAGIIVPESFNQLGDEVQKLFTKLVQEGEIVIEAEPEVPVTAKDFVSLKKAGMVRKPANFVCSISDDRGEECTYSGMPISKVVQDGMGVGGAISLLWFRRKLPDHCLRFLEMCLVICADHGPAVSGAHNTVVAARAGKDLISSLCSGLLTIGPRFGGALDDAAKMFSKAADGGVSPKQFVNDCKKNNILIMGIGHRIKSKANPDMRVELVKEYALKHFGEPKVLNFALGVEEITTSKKANLILNVDGCIACCFVDMLRSSGAFKYEEIDELVDHGCLNGLFVLARSAGFIGHYLDQKRLKQPLYRHPWDDITYITADEA